MSEILFRAKHTHASSENKHLDGSWVEGYLSDKNHINSPRLDGEFLIDEKTICRDTDKRDRFGKKIYEGSIVEDNFDKSAVGVVEFGEHGTEYGFYIKWKTEKALSYRDDLLYWVNKARVKVIGNIYDNPELLEEQTDTEKFTNADRIRRMTDDELVDLLEWRLMPDKEFIPDCDEGCEHFCKGCKIGCPPETREKAIKEWLKKEVAE